MKRKWVRHMGAILVICAVAALLFLLSRLEIGVEPDALRGPLTAALTADARLAQVCPGDRAPAAPPRVESIDAKRPFIGSEGSGRAVVVLPSAPPCRARVEFRLTHESGPRRDTTDRGHYLVQVTAVEPMAADGTAP
jgi:hypothetical protein